MQLGGVKDLFGFEILAYLVYWGWVLLRSWQVFLGFKIKTNRVFIDIKRARHFLGYALNPILTYW